MKEYVKLQPEDKDDKPYPEEGEAQYFDDEALYPEAGEAAYVDGERHIIPKNWPRSGEIEFRDVTIRYDPDGPDILSNINLKFKAGERVAVVGRTGSGKSTVRL